MASLVAVSTAMAEPFDSKLQAAVFNTKLVQAADECASPTTIIGGIDACAPANLTTAPTDPANVAELFSVGKLLVKSKNGTSQVLGILKSSGNGDTGFKKDLAGKTLAVRLVLRVTKRTTGTPAEAVTWEDQTLTCTVPVTVGSNGNFLYKGGLAGSPGCGLSTALANEGFQKEIVSASIVDFTSNKAVAVPGVRKK
jgi:hypothetical protein